ncbi:precorrin-3B synthase [Bradyrhizobium sp.]|uniref:precorrin-3B synthase n=1 Tax=Bradyrhizobium sp. TaxID=376 RepID=UPI003C49B624
MSRFEIKGWCPSALRPMLSGDGLVVRIRPHGGRLSRAQAAGIAEFAGRYGNGLIDLTGRANLQIRGVRPEDHDALIKALAQLDLIDADVDSEVQRNILVAPFWRAGDDTSSIAAELELALAGRSLGLPAKFGFAVDCGDGRTLAQASADIRIERGLQDQLIVRPDGMPQGHAVAKADAVGIALALADWFVASGGVRNGRGRMAAHIAGGVELPEALAGRAMPGPAAPPPQPRLHAGGALVGLAFGQIQGATLKFLAGLAPGLRMTPWRMVFLEDAQEMPRHEGLVTQADDPVLRIAACTGAPACPQAHAETRAFAAALASSIPAEAQLHVSGCAKGCAYSSPASITLVGASDGFDLICDGTAQAVPRLRGLDAATILAKPAVLWGAA